MPLGHLGLNVHDLEASRAYYAQIMGPLGFELFLDHPDEFAYRPTGGKPGTFLFFYPEQQAPIEPYSRHATGLQHLAFIVRSRSDVIAVRDTVAALGSEIVHEPQVFPQYPQPYFATFWLDPSGFLLEAVCHHDRD
ncbi:MAG: VOC family protein [Actinomycetota bacterium]|nr:VOC family protein [Actinomycetota bacterium]